MVILGLDVSTTTIGYAYTKYKKIQDMGFIDISKKTSIQEKAYKALDVIEENNNMKKVSKIIVEDNLSGFAFGRTSQQTIIKLAKFNAVFCFIIENATGKPVISVNPATARKKVFGKARVKGIKSKDFVKMKIEEQYDTSNFIKLNNKQQFDKRNIDMYDALVCALYG